MAQGKVSQYTHPEQCRDGRLPGDHGHGSVLAERLRDLHGGQNSAAGRSLEQLSNLQRLDLVSLTAQCRAAAVQVLQNIWTQHGRVSVCAGAGKIKSCGDCWRSRDGDGWI